MELKTKIHAEDGKQELVITREFDLPLESINLTDPTPVVPNVAALLTQAQFQPLKEWLREHAVDMAKLQAYVDGVLEEVRMRLSEQNKMKDRS